MFDALLFILCSHFLAQMNSVARIPRPIGITIKAGPGKNTIASPINSNVKPITEITSFLACFIVLPKKSFILILLFYKKRPSPRNAAFIAVKVLLVSFF